MSGRLGGGRSVVTCFLAALLVFSRAASAQPIAFPAHEVYIVVTLHDARVADVVEQYMLTASLDETRWAFLASPCTEVERIAATLGDRPVAVAIDNRTRAPWTQLRLASSMPDRGGAGEALMLRYDVRLSGSDATVPIVLPSAVLQRPEGARGASVRIDVRVDNDAIDARVLLPRFERAHSGRMWQGRFLAVPAFVRIRLTGAAGCDRWSSESAGGLEWRTVVFVGTMAMWVPVYLWWFGRERG